MVEVREVNGGVRNGVFYDESYATVFFINAVFSDDDISWDAFNSESFVGI